MAYSNAEIYDRNKSEAEREQKLLSKLKQISARGNNAEVKQDRDGNWVVYEVKNKGYCLKRQTIGLRGA